ncbi:Protein of unknown function [Bacillus mycoides]|uniref:Uncharacterized protein n=1 Tax=Bacillus mycoides TaxID=1405 RepID=A0A1G4EAG1_BACMY|nr:Protein of unknown function [Bacillus mycoides]
MSKRKRTTKIDKWLKEVSEADYQPWLKI